MFKKLLPWLGGILIGAFLSTKKDSEGKSFFEKLPIIGGMFKPKTN